MNSQSVRRLPTTEVESDSAAHEQTRQGPRFYSIPVPHLTLPRGAAISRTSHWSVSDGKRAMDILVSAGALLLLTPGLILIALLIAMESKGPVLFTQRRVGRLGQLFTISKFRTMHFAPHQCGPIITQCGDARITVVGKMLRKFKMDELPQFYNVLLGDMSLVGPRPKIAQHEGMHMPFRPGITGAATLAFRHEEEILQHIAEGELDTYYASIIIPLKTKIDSEYMQRASFKSDLAIIFRTAAACVLPRSVRRRLPLGECDPCHFDLERLNVTVSVGGDPSQG